MTADARFLDVWTAAGAGAGAPAAFAELSRRLAEPARHYHTLAHVLATLAALDTCRHRLVRPAEAELALWYHDAVYDTGRNDNEARSADLAAATLEAAGMATDVAARIRSMIGDTRHAEPASSPDGQLVADADLAILAAEPSVFDAYDAAIREEYGWVPEPVYRAERRRILAEFLSRPRIYQSECFRQRFEAAARANLERAVQRLYLSRPEGE